MTKQQCASCEEDITAWNENELFFGSYYLTCRSCGHPFFDITRDEARASDIDLRTPDKGLPFHDFRESLDELKAAFVDNIIQPLYEVIG